MKVEIIQDFNLRDIVLISSLPDMGKVGGLVTQHLARKLKTKQAAKIFLEDKPWVNLKKGLIELPHDEYVLTVDEKNSVVIFTGENQPQEPGSVFDIVKSVLSTVSKMGNIRMVISAGGYLPSENVNGIGVFGVATNPNSLDLLGSFNIKPLASEVNTITWFNGLILGVAKKQNIDGIGLFGQITDPEMPQYKAASKIINVIEKILKIKISTAELDEKVVDSQVEVKKEGPGIG